MVAFSIFLIVRGGLFVETTAFTNPGLTIPPLEIIVYDPVNNYLVARSTRKDHLLSGGRLQDGILGSSCASAVSPTRNGR